MQGNAQEFNKYYPGKTFVKQAAKALGMKLEPYVELVSSALKAQNGDPLSTLGKRLEVALDAYLPARHHENED